MSVDIRPILLVEDNPMDVDLTRRAFARQKISNPIQIARDGEAAISFIDKWAEGELLPQIILLDLKLPRVDGLDVLQRLKTHPIYRQIPVIILTSSSDSGDISRAYQLGANSYIIKPVDFDKFLEVANLLHSYWCNMNTQPG
jgi:CheY-like chemotaxis protein